MELKKTQKADLQNKKAMFFEIGLAAALIVMLVAFNWKSAAKEEVVADNGPSVVIEEENVPVTKEDQPKPQEIPKVIHQVDNVVIGSNDLKLDLDLSAFNAEDDKKGITPMEYFDKKEKVKEEEVKEEIIPFAVVEEKPKFNGGDANSFVAWVQAQIAKEGYPQAAADNNIQGTVYVGFIVAADGSLTNIKVLRQIDPLLGDAAIRAVKLSPKWTPGKQRNKAVPVSYQIPVKFTLSER